MPNHNIQRTRWGAPLMWTFGRRMMMKRLLSCLAVLLLTWAGPAHARLRSEYVTATNTSFPELSFDISVQDHGNVTFAVKVTPVNPPALSTNIVGKMIVRDQDGEVAACAVQPEQDGNSLVFKLTLHKKLLPATVFHLVSPRRHGNIVSGTVYSVQLKEFMNKETSEPEH